MSESRKFPSLSARIAIAAALLAGFAAVLFPRTFLRASTRSPVSRARADLRSMAVALESYHFDYGAYPAWTVSPDRNIFRDRRFWPRGVDMGRQPTFALRDETGTIIPNMTTPVPYISGFFGEAFGTPRPRSYSYWANRVPDDDPLQAAGWIMWSMGPDGDYDITIQNVESVYNPNVPAPGAGLLGVTYDPTNGTFSSGDVYRFKI